LAIIPKFKTYIFKTSASLPQEEIGREAVTFRECGNISFYVTLSNNCTIS